MQFLLIILLVLCNCQHLPQTEAFTTQTDSLQHCITNQQSQQHILRSNDSGSSWDEAGSGIPADAGIWRAMKTNDRIVLLAGKSLYERPLADVVSTSWSETYFSAQPLSDIDQDEQGLVILAYETGIFRNIPGTETLLPIHANLPDLHVRGYTNTSFGIFFSAESGLYHSTDKGATWQQVITGGFANKVRQSENNLFTTTDFGVMKSSDGGKNWQVVDAAGQPSAPLMQYNTHLACISDDIKGKDRKWGQSLRYSPDGGKTWTQLEKNLPEFGRINDFDMNDQFMYCSTQTGVYRSADAGKSWEMIHGPSEDKNGYLDILVIGKTVYLIPVVGC